jgi:hypothetical protein
MEVKSSSTFRIEISVGLEVSLVVDEYSISCSRELNLSLCTPLPVTFLTKVLPLREENHNSYYKNDVVKHQ